jgi:hypothetical protein
MADDYEKKFAMLRLTADGMDRLIIQPVFMKKNNSMAAAKRKVMKQFENGTTSWIGWVDQYTLFDPIKMGEK